MLIQTHHYLATLICQYMENKYNIDLKPNILHYGSIVPDLIGKYARVPHYYDLSYDSFYQMELEQMLQDEKYCDAAKFSYKLGVLLHFTADYFCLAHNDEVYRKSMWQHFNYEMCLHHEFLTFDKNELFKYKVETVEMDLHKQHDSYLQVKPNIQNDITSIWQASVNLTDNLIKQILLPSRKELGTGIAA